MRKFLPVWLGQTISLTGSGLTSFGLGVWVYQSTGSITRFALMSLFIVLPGLLFSPLVGVFVDRWPRRWSVAASDCGSALMVLLISLLLWSHRLQIWHLYVLLGINSLFQAMHLPAMISWTSELLDRRHFSRANGLLQLGDAAARIAAPVLAGALLAWVHLWGLLVLDFVSFFFGIATIVLTPRSELERRRPPARERASLWQDAILGWHYIKERKGLLALLLLFAGSNFTFGAVQALLTPLVLSFSTPKALGVVLAAAGTGLLASSLALSFWSGPRQATSWILRLVLLQGVVLCVCGLRPNLLLVGAGAVIYALCSAPINNLSQTLWQAKVAMEIQGRVFSIRRMVAWSALPLAYVVIGPLADRVFEPAMRPAGLLAGRLGPLIGTGPGRGIGLLFIVMGILVLVMVAVAYRYPHLRRIEIDLPDSVPDYPEGLPGEGI